MLAKFQPLEITIQNFLSVGEEQTFRFTEGLFLILGENEDSPCANSNGSGKSLLVEAVCWVLWGETIRGLKGEDSVINRQVGKNCKVSLKFRVQDEEYTVVRVRGASDKYAKKNDLQLLPGTANSMAETQAVINQLVGISFETFALMMPGARADVANMTHGQIVASLEELLGLESLFAARKKVTAEINKLNSCFADLTEEMNALKLVEYEANAIVQQYATVDLTQRKLALAQEYIQYTNNKAEDALEHKLSSLKTEYATVDTEFKDLAALLTTLNTEMARIDTHNKELRKEIEREIGTLTEQTETLSAKLQKLKKQEGSCSLCFSPITPEHIETHVRLLREEMSDLRDKYQGRLSVLENDLAESLAEGVKVQERKKETACYVEHTMSTRQKLATQIESFQKDLSKLRMQRTVRKAEIDAELRALEEQAQTQQKVIEEKTNVVKEARDAQKAKQAELTKLEENIAHYKWWYDSLDLNNFRVHVLSSLLPYLSSRAQQYANILSSDELTIKFCPKKKDKMAFHVKVVNKHGADSYTGLSAGEKAKVNLCVALAIADLAANYSKVTPTFRLFDEAFDGLDDEGMLYVGQLLSMQAQKHPSIYVISHHDVLKQSICNTVTMRKKHGFTTIESHT